jgi:hypothetical protein
MFKCFCDNCGEECKHPNYMRSEWTKAVPNEWNPDKVSHRLIRLEVQFCEKCYAMTTDLMKKVFPKVVF